MLEVKDLTVRYPDGTKAVDSVTFTIGDGESAALVGANGAGKTTLMLALVGVVPISAGTVTVDGVTLDKRTLGEIRRRVGMVFQNPDDQLFMPMVRDDVAFGPRNYGLDEETVRQRTDGALNRLGIGRLKDRSSLKLSGGEKRLAAIATVLAMEPSALLLDEPTAFLDPRARRNLIRILSALGHSKLIATHDLQFAEEVTTRAILLREGTVFAEGDPNTLFYDEKLMDACSMEAIDRHG
jgi:cobalt/nickel transport system ATP-binding protein